ncbi:MAG: DUF6057 family protein [Bacteroidales bacterium]|nr:DUF6057 family protein [Bacteroidales bacterium]
MKKYIICILATLAIGMGYLLSHSEILMLAEYTNPVAMSPETFSDLMQQPMGLLSWAGCWIVQLFHIPALGALTMSALWAAITALLIKCWQLDKYGAALAMLPSVALLWSIGCLGYWMHYSNLTGYYASHTLAVLVAAIMLCVSRKSLVAAILSPWLLYPAMGFWAVALGVAAAALLAKNSGIRALIPAASAILSPMAWHTLCYARYMPLAHAWTAGLPTLLINDVSGSQMLIPLYVCAICLAAVAFIRELRPRPWLQPSIAMAMLMLALGGSSHSSQFYQEIRMQKAAVEGNWGLILESGDNNAELTETMKVFYEMAMAQTQTLGSHGFIIHHSYADNPESRAIKVNAMQMAAPIIHYYYGRYNISTRWCVEVGVKYGFGTGLLRMLAMSALANGETAAAMKYREIIRRQMFFGNWEIPSPSHITADFHTGIQDRLETDHDCDEYLKYIATLPANIHTKTAAMQAMYYAMQDRNMGIFRAMAYNDSLMDRPLQRHYQEACLMMLDSIPQGLVEPHVEQSFSQFKEITQQLQATQNKDLIKPIHQKFGNTYWWYAMFEKQ